MTPKDFATFRLWFFRDLTNDQRLQFLHMCRRPGPGAELTTHAAQLHCLKGICQQPKEKP